MATQDKLRDYLQRATADLRQVKRRLREAEAKEHEPMAIVGMSCRYPGGVTSPTSCGNSSPRAATASRPFPSTGAGTSTGCTTPNPPRPDTPTPARAASSTRPTGSTPTSSG